MTERYLFLSVDVRDYSQYNDTDQERIQEELVRLTADALRHAALDWEDLQPGGDGQLIVIRYRGSPLYEPALRFCLHLHASLRVLNEGRELDRRLRMRL